MGDISAEPSMEDILSSIKRIIAEEGEASVSSRVRRSPRSVASRDRAPEQASDPADVLELSDPVAAEEMSSPGSARAPSSGQQPTETILSESAAEASRGALETLSRLVVKPATGSATTLEDMVRDMLRPMLREWLDARLPEMVETMVAREIARITQGR